MLNLDPTEPSDFVKVMAAKSDQELIEIVFYKKSDYVLEAMACAEEELLKRNFKEVDLDDLKTRTEIKISAERKIAQLKLGLGWKMACFFMPGLLPLITILYYQSQGYENASNEAVKWTLYGILFYSSFPILIVLSDVFF
jgi:hypothetical protein